MTQIHENMLIPIIHSWGGYDQSRVLGDVAIYDLDGKGNSYGIVSLLLDIQIGVEIGDSPFNESSITNLLRINSSLVSDGAQPTNISPTVPYFFMAPETCSAIAEHLPIKLQRYTGLYLWDTTNPLYTRIVQSPAYLAFVFGTTGAKNLTIKIPFKLLNLTLDEPLASPPLPYFPCKPFSATDHSNHYWFGKAFLQAAFLGVNWETRKAFLAQAPGPDASAPNIQSIEDDDTMIKSDLITSFANSWAKTWIPIEGSKMNGGGTPPAGVNKVPTSSPSTTRNSSLSGGAKAGLAVGVVVGSLAAVGLLAVLFLRRRKRNEKATSKPQNGVPQPEREILMPDPYQYVPPVEKDGKGVGGVSTGGENIPVNEVEAGQDGAKSYELDVR